MMTRMIPLLLVLSLAACGDSGGLFDGGGGPSAAASPSADDTRPTERPGDEDGAVAGLPDPAGEGQFLGYSVASIGDVTRTGMWMETPLVSTEGPGRVVAPNGTTVILTLIPTGGDAGSGSRLSLQAMQALGLSLTDLPTVTVISDA